MEELLNWLTANKMSCQVLDKDVVLVDGLGKVFFEDTSQLTSIFRKNRDGEMEFNLLEDKNVLLREGINYVTFKFGDNWYYFNLNTGYALNIFKYAGTKVPCKCQTPVVNLGCHTGFELLNGSFMPKDWVKKAKFYGHSAIGVCDMNTMAALFNLQKDCDAAGIKPVFGYSFVFKDDEGVMVEAKVFCQSQESLRGMSRIQKAIMVDSEDKTIPFDELLKWGFGMVLVFGKLSAQWLIGHQSELQKAKGAFEGVYYQVDLSEYKAERIDIVRLEAAAAYFHNLYPTLQPVLLTDAYYLDKDDADNKIILNKVDIGAAHEQSNDQYFKDADEHFVYFQALFGPEWNKDAVFEECAANAVKIAEKAEARFVTDRNFMPQYDMTPEEKVKYGTPHKMFVELLEEGLQRLIPEADQPRYRKQMEYEKYIIESTDNVDYLLVQYDTCNWARKNNILVGCGRGSAAGSLLLYLLGITLIDPLKYDLIFERFLLPERAGLYPAKTTIIGEDISSNDYLIITLENGKNVKVDKDAELIVKRQGVDEPMSVYADELMEDDDILFDNHDLLFVLPEIWN